MADYSVQQKRFDDLSRDVLLLSRNILLVNLRFLDLALHQLELVSDKTDSLSTDGKHLFYCSSWILEHYKNQKNIITRHFLHVVFHCIFRHMYGIPYGNKIIWDLACDIAVEASISDLSIQTLTVEVESKQQKVIHRIRKKIGILSAEKIYRYYLDSGITINEIIELQELFRADDHVIWYQISNNEKDHAEKTGKNDDTRANGRRQGVSEVNRRTGDVDGYDYMSSFSGSGNQAKIWNEIASRVQVDLEAFFRNKGDEPGTLLQNLNSVNREKYDYESFLRKFAVRSEMMKINDDEFDYVFYTYGLNLFKNMPLIEPLEYKEIKRIREFVVAIDTSGSVAGEKVQRFVQKTYNILKSTESFIAKMNLHIFQCDANIQEHVKISTQDDLDRYISNLTIHGLGGTDFRPVFCEVDKLIKKHEFVNLKGLIYLTDGYGVFPEKKPDYQTAFVFVEDNYTVPEVPSWAITLVLHPEEI